MATVVNHKDVILQAAVIRITPVLIDLSDLDQTLQDTLTNADATTYIVSGMGDDNILSIIEKPAVRDGLAILDTEKNTILANATAVGATIGVSAFTNAFAVMKAYVDPLLVDMSTDSVIVGSVFLGHVSLYYDTREVLLKSISLSVDGKALAAQAILDDVASDNKVTPGEKIRLKETYDMLLAEYLPLKADADTIVQITVETADFTAKAVLANDQYVIILADMTTTSTIDGVAFSALVTNYLTAKTNLLAKMAVYGATTTTDALSGQISALDARITALGG